MVILGLIQGEIWRVRGNIFFWSYIYMCVCVCGWTLDSRALITDVDR